jgi:hypothetical protein
MRRLLGSAAAIVLPTPGTRERVDRSFPELAGRTVEIRNGFDPADFAGAPPEPAGDVFHVVHAGYFYGDVGRRRLRRLIGGTDVPTSRRRTGGHVRPRVGRKIGRSDRAKWAGRPWPFGRSTD